MNYLWIGLLLVLSYLIGSVPFGLIVGKIAKKIDIREYGSKNMGATNAVRVLGFKLGFIVFLLDAIKGAAVILLVKLLYFINPENLDFVHAADFNIIIFYGFVAVIGNVFPVFAGFRGGKAVACTVGAILALVPAVGGLSFALFAVVLLLTGYVSLASVCAAVTCLTLTFLDIGLKIWTTDGNFYRYMLQLIGVSMIILFLIIRHIPNIKRLIKGTEPSFNIGLRKYLNKKKELNNNETEEKRD